MLDIYCACLSISLLIIEVFSSAVSSLSLIPRDDLYFESVLSYSKEKGMLAKKSSSFFWILSFNANPSVYPLAICEQKSVGISITLAFSYETTEPLGNETLYPPYILLYCKGSLKTPPSKQYSSLSICSLFIVIQGKFLYSEVGTPL